MMDGGNWFGQSGTVLPLDRAVEFHLAVIFTLPNARTEREYGYVTILTAVCRLC